MKYRYDKGAHAVYSIQFHLVFCVKYRRRVLEGPVAERLKEIVRRVAERFGVEIIEQETALDHIHILFAGKPQLQVSKFVNSLKGVSSRLLRKEFPELKRHLWGGHFWSPRHGGGFEHRGTFLRCGAPDAGGAVLAQQGFAPRKDKGTSPCTRGKGGIKAFP